MTDRHGAKIAAERPAIAETNPFAQAAAQKRIRIGHAATGSVSSPVSMRCKVEINSPGSAAMTFRSTSSAVSPGSTGTIT